MPILLTCTHCGCDYKRKPREAKTSKFCSYECKGSHPKSPETIERNRAASIGQARNFKGGIRRSKRGYVEIYSPSHPHKTANDTVREHRLVMEKHLGRYLLPSEVVHHKNEIRDDNRLENLELFSSNGEHARLHGRHEKTANNSEQRQCFGCGTVKALNAENFGRSKTYLYGFTYMCRHCKRAAVSRYSRSRKKAESA